MSMDINELREHLRGWHGLDSVAEVVAGSPDSDVIADENYARGFHDGLHGRIDADDLNDNGHGALAAARS